MFDAFNMENNYDDRLVNNTEINNAIIDTCAVYDSEQPFETAIQHPEYNDNKFIVVEMYNNKTDAKKGHDKWIEIFRKDLPDTLEDVSSYFARTLLKIANEHMIFERKSINNQYIKQ